MNKESAIRLESLLACTKDKDFNEKNISNYKRLIDSWNADRSISFLGAGTSNPLGIKDWQDLMKLLQEEVKKRYGKDIDVDKDDLPPIAENLSNEFEAKDHAADFDNIIFRNMDPQYNSTTLTIVKLALLLDKHITTNFDISISNAYNFLNYIESYLQANKRQSKDFYQHSIPDLPNYHQIFRQKGAHVIYLHGKKDGPYVFKLRDYNKFYPSAQSNSYSKCIEDCLKSFLKETSFLFIGFSFNDIRLKEMIFRIIAEIKKDILINSNFLGTQVRSEPYATPRHYLLVHNNEEMYGSARWDGFYHEFEQYGIYPVIY
ncbi:MAG: SIR2 family protein, partial [Euryarchaeota archaeon]|nr:SIR2 family protein [Euryarchaeota archaeon]